MSIEKATLGGGCFWCTEAIYQELAGVIKVQSGYAGGTVADPTYQQICTGLTGHAEVVQIDFNSGLVSYRQIVEVFFTIHDPTTLNRQGNDVGSQYRSVVFYHTAEQQKIAAQIMAEMANVWDAPLVTELTAVPVFYRAEDYHQNYYRQHPDQGYCAFVVAPKLAKFRKITVFVA